MDSKSLAGIEPFNDLFFRNCFYNSMFAVLNYYQKSILPFTINSVPIYDLDENEQLTMKYITTLEQGEVLNQNEVIVNTKQNNKNVVEDIILAINLDKPVIVDIDCFDMPMRTEFYQKTHWQHVILIYGYDNNRKTFNIIEQKNVDCLNYEKVEISYDDLINSYNGFLNLSAENLVNVSYREYGIMEKTNLINQSELLSVFKENILNNKNVISYGLSYLDKFENDFDNMLLEDQSLRENIDNLIPGINEIINSKKVAKYNVENLFGKDHQLNKLICDIEKNWTAIRQTLLKFKFSSLYGKDNLFKIKDMLLNIKGSEQLYYDTIYNTY